MTVVAILIIAWSQSATSSAQPAPQGRPLTGAEIRAAYLGNTSYSAGRFGPKTTAGYFSPDGTVKLRSPDISDVGTYNISDEGVYFSKFTKISIGTENCMTIYRIGQNLFEAHLTNGTVLQVLIVPGNPEGL